MRNAPIPPCASPSRFPRSRALFLTRHEPEAPIGTSTPAPATGLPGDAEPTASPAAPAPTNQPAVLPNFEGTTAEPVNPYVRVLRMGGVWLDTGE